MTLPAIWTASPAKRSSACCTGCTVRAGPSSWSHTTMTLPPRPSAPFTCATEDWTASSRTALGPGPSPRLRWDMNLTEFLRLAWESISGNKLRSLLTMLGIIIGVASVIIMVGISAGTSAAIEAQITGLGSNLLFVQSALVRFGPGAGPRGEDFTLAAGGGLVYDHAFVIADH